MSFLLWAAPTALASLWGFTPETMCAVADAVVVAEVTSQEVEWTEAGGLLTRSWVHVERVVRGEQLGHTLEVVALGGERDGHFQRVEHQALLQVDQRYLLVLDGRRAAWRVIAGEHGAVPLQEHDDGTSALAALGGCR